MKIKKLLYGIACMLLVPSMMVTAAEDSGIKAGIENVAASEGIVSAYISQNQGEVYDLAGSDVKLLLNDQELEVVSKSYLRESNEPISYYCMVDVSGSMDEDRMNTVRTILNQMVETKKEEDNFCISTIGNTLNNMGLSQDSAQIQEMIDGIAVTKEDTNLYYGITEMIKTMQKDEGVHTLRYFILFSDGAEDQATGITREEAVSEIENSHIPVFTVAMLKSKSSDAELESAKILGSFARKSIGGLHFTPTLDEYEYGEIPERIANTIRAGILVQGKIGDPALSGEEITVKVTGLTESDTKLEIKVPSNVIQQAIVIPEPETEDETGTTESAPEEIAPVETDIEEASMNSMLYVYIGIALAAFIILIVIIIIVVKNKKAKESPYAESELGMQEPEMNQEENLWSASAPSFASSVSPDIPSVTPAQVKATKALRLVRIGINETAEYEIKLAEEFIIGRNADSCDLTITDDVSLSGQHCKIMDVDGEIFVEDMKSSNGTFVNGVPITGSFLLDKDDIIIIGSYEYRISW